MKGTSIVLATDLSESSAEAARWAHAAGKRHHLPVTVIHVISISMANWASGAYDALEDPSLMAKLREDLTRWYRNETGAAPDEVRILVGHTTVQLRENVEKTDAAMLVVATSDKSRWQQFFVGSTAQALAHRPPCPLILVRPEDGADAAALPGPGEMAVGIDFSPNSGDALVFAADHARACGAKLHLVHAGKSPQFMAGLEHFPQDLITTDYQDWAHEEMDKFTARYADSLQGLEYQAHLLEDYPSHGLLEFTRDNPVDMLVIGRAGHSSLLSDTMGDVLLKVIQSIPTTTCVVPVVAAE